MRSLPPNMDSAGASAADLVGSFRILDGVAEVLGMILEGQGTSVSNAAAGLQARFAAAEALLDSLPGGDMTRDAQLKEATRLVAELEKKRKLVEKHRNLPLLAEKLGSKQANTSAGEEVEKQEEDVDILTAPADEPSRGGEPGNQHGTSTEKQPAADIVAEVLDAMQADIPVSGDISGEKFGATASSLDASAVAQLTDDALDLGNDSYGGPLSDSMIDEF